MRKLYVEMDYTETRVLTQIVCFELDEAATAGMTDDEIMKKYGKWLTCAAADGGMVEPDGSEPEWDRRSFDLHDYGLTTPDEHDEIRTERPLWVPEICAKT